ncbi:MAG: hypothetical protein KKC76_06610 [Proteobacteria bacterium]|nr:hypothetical protein [Pseudomonadota bacterium]MCG2749502.1 hypothetical protein [Desulfobulbaceae bacterium]
MLRKSDDQSMTETTKVDKILFKLKNNRFVSVIVVIAIIFLAIISLAEGVQKAGKLFGSTFAKEQSSINFDKETLDSFVKIVRNIDLFLLKLELSKNEVLTLEQEFDLYVTIQADLNSWALRNTLSSLNDISVKNSQLMAQQWEDLGLLLKNGANRKVISSASKAIQMSMNSILIYGVYILNSGNRSQGSGQAITVRQQEITEQ